MQYSQLRIGFIGAGKAASALAMALYRSGWQVSAIYSRSWNRAVDLCKSVSANLCLTTYDVLLRADVVFICIPDRFIQQVAYQLARCPSSLEGKCIVHTSGTLDIDVLEPVRASGGLIGIFHPYQTLASRDSWKLLSKSFVGIDAPDPVFQLLSDIVRSIALDFFDLRNVSRVPYHISAVMASNYLIALLLESRYLLEKAGIPQDQAYRAVISLAVGALQNASELGLENAITGPLSRGDIITLHKHLQYLENAELYKALTAYKSLGLLLLEHIKKGKGKHIPIDQLDSLLGL
ncbi:NADP oxidoreductase coenzyme F420-dependent [Thermobaculum terrenum ATCC BAA-798]|uniref:NADP oxidoreductase coenzyme F420-dependent n=1 Tax=Thermobaculum terrenum (strain ATCC BAA-798 / CCMEE 7001 / YNP1) TaxID=525904 RepID=D1CBL0_THET1|nr:DUF2520 domain-containing protein [Thermobaculum terrenum]ACZ42175.1 NADP oxidoreductase coenzyme F420-dependent [Thermobaculum terrenum ATCC BAA-798]